MTLLIYLFETTLIIAVGYVWTRAARPTLVHNGFKGAGFSYFSGLFLITLIVYVFDLLSVPVHAAGIWGTTTALAVTGAIVVHRRRRNIDLMPFEPHAATAAIGIVDVFLILLILVKISYVVAESFAEIRRTDDAFTWSLSLAKHMYYEGEIGSFIMKWNYPKMTGIVIGCFSLLFQPFNEFAPNLPFMNNYIFFLVLFYGAIADVVSRRWAIAATYIVSALPLVLTHTVMIGYSDLFLGMVNTGVVIFAYQHLRSGNNNDLYCAMVFCCILPFTKLEGFFPYFPIGLLTIASSAVYQRGLLSAGKIWAIVCVLGVIVFATLAGFVAIYGDQAPSFLNQRLYERLMPENHFFEAVPRISQQLFYHYNNWMLVGPIAIAVVVIGAAVTTRKPEFAVTLPAMLMLIAYVYLTCFGFGYWGVRDVTLTNRLLLHQIIVHIYTATVLLGREKEG